MRIEELLDGIGSQRFDAEVDARLEETLTLLERVSPGARRFLLESFTLVALRALETRLLADPELRTLALFWRAQAGVADTVINRRVEALTGVPPSDTLRRHLRSCIRSRSSREGEKESVPPDVYRDTVSALLQTTRARELRCEACGYHFLSDDLGDDRREIIADLSPAYAASRHPRRLTDPLKPWQTNRGNSLTRLTIDHVTPEAGFGWTGDGNHAVLCFLCNEAKAIYRSPMEPVSTVVAATLQASPETRAHSRPRQIAVWAAIAASGACAACGDTTGYTELTVALPDEMRNLRWLAPWSAEVICYECIVRRDNAS